MAVHVGASVMQVGASVNYSSTSAATDVCDIVQSETVTSKDSHGLCVVCAASAGELSSLSQTGCPGHNGTFINLTNSA